jgi:hypothetical protein
MGPQIRLPLTMMAVLGVILAAGIVAGHIHRQPAPASTPPTTLARIVLRGTVTAARSAGCRSAPGTVRAGAPVRLLDPDGAVLGTTTLGHGSTQGRTCVWSYTVTGPSVTSYQVQVAGLPPASVSAATLRRSHWHYAQPDVVAPSSVGNIESGV